MEVPLPEVQSRYNFSDPAELVRELEEYQTGSYSQKLAEFVNSKTQELQMSFMRLVRIRNGNPNPDLHEQVWTASSDLIKRHWELAYQFEWEDVESEVQELEGIKRELEQKFCEFEREMDCFREATLYLCSPCIMTFQKMMDLQQCLKQMVLKMYPLFLTSRDYSVVGRVLEFRKRAAMLNMPVEYSEDQSIFGDLRKEILFMELGDIASIVCKQNRAIKRVRSILWNKWLRDEAYKFLKRVILLRVKNEEWDLLDYPFYEMFQSLSDLPQEYYALLSLQPSEGVQIPN